MMWEEGARGGMVSPAFNYVGSWHEWSRHDDLPVER
jgi:3-mercaptopyruvate sulfurtransferase SseA